MAYRVTAPYVTVRVHDDATGKDTVVGIYEGGVLPANADPDSVKSLLAKGMVAAADSEGPPAEVSDAPAAAGRPRDSASKAEWVDYAVSRRDESVPEEDARADAESRSKSDLIQTFGTAEG